MQPWLERWTAERAAAVRSVRAGTDDPDLVELLASPTRSEDAYALLMARGWAAQPAVRDGLRHPDARVRRQCVRVVDHFLDDAALPALEACLDDDDAGVRMTALHTLTCERCKEGSCRPDGGRVLRAALRLLASDPSPHVRAMAAEVVGAAVHTSDDARSGLESARTGDASAAVRKKVGWYLPGGAIHARTAR